MEPTGRCRSCNAEIRWARHHDTDRAMPLDPDPVEDGNIAIVEWRGTRRPYTPIVRVGDDGPTAVTEYRYVSHFATCPNAASHRRRD